MGYNTQGRSKYLRLLRPRPNFALRLQKIELKTGGGLKQHCLIIRQINCLKTGQRLKKCGKKCSNFSIVKNK